MATIRDTLISRIPNYILEDYPRFFDFLAAYYEWLEQEGNSYNAIKKHMDYMNFVETLDDYVDYMKQEYLNDIPESVLTDKEQFIKWSKKFNLTRGSHASYKFLFRLLFNDQNMEIYVPKENIFRLSDGNWISGESLMLVTHSNNNLQQFQYQTIFQERPIYNDIVERATAVVQRVRTKYSGRYILTELAISDIEGEFKQGFPIQTQNGATEWMVPTVNNIDVTTPGSGFQVGQRVYIDGFDTNVVTGTADAAGSFDTKVTSFFKPSDLSVKVNDVTITGFGFDGRYVTDGSINEGDSIEVTMPGHQGYAVVDALDENQGVDAVEILDLPIGNPVNPSLSYDNGSGFTGSIELGYIKPVKGYYEGTKGQLSSNMYLQDSFFYQDYSYAIRTSQDFTAYSDIVKQVLHPGGFLMFGQLSVIEMLEILISYAGDEITAYDNSLGEATVPKYGLGTNFTFIDRFKDGVSNRLYSLYHFNTRNMEYVVGEEGYNLESEFLGRFSSYQYYRDYYEGDYYEEGYLNMTEVPKGWMNKDSLADYYLYIPQDYTEENDSGDLYFETGYTSPRT